MQRRPKANEISAALDFYERSFGAQREPELDLPLGEAAASVAEARLVVAVAGRNFDFARVAAVREASKWIFEQPTREARAAALEQVPAAFRETVKLMVERSFYNAKRLRELQR